VVEHAVEEPVDNLSSKSNNGSSSSAGTSIVGEHVGYVSSIVGEHKDAADDVGASIVGEHEDAAEDVGAVCWLATASKPISKTEVSDKNQWSVSSLKVGFHKSGGFFGVCNGTP
jgi:hypothetical protein